MKSKSDSVLVNETINENGIKELNIAINANYIENIIQQILSLKKSIHYSQMSYEGILNIISKKHFYNDQIKSFLLSIPQLFSVFTDLNAKIKQLFPKQNNDLLTTGSYEATFLKRGSALYNNSYFYQGEFNQENYEFKGVIIPDITKQSMSIGLVSKGFFEGIEMKKGDNGLTSITIYTLSFQIELNSENEEICFYSISEPKELYYFKEQAYFVMEDTKAYINNCYYYLVNSVILSFQTTIEESIESKPVTLLYDNNHLYIGNIKNFKRNGEGNYYIRPKNVALSDSEMASYQLIGTFENNEIKKGRVFKNNTFVFEGVFENNKPRKGIYNFSDLECYDGEIKNNQFEGIGEYKYDNGNIFSGEFRNNLPFYGNFTDSFGTINNIKIVEEMLVFNKNKDIKEEENMAS